MSVRTALSTFALGAAAIVGIHVFIASVAAQSEDVFDVCVKADGTMREIAPSAACPAGEQRMRLKQPKLEPPCETEKKPDLAAMASRLTALEGSTNEGMMERAPAPFKVVNENGTVVFSLEAPEQGPGFPTTEIFNATGARVAVIAANDEGGAVTVESGEVRPRENIPNGISAISASLSAHGEYAELSTYLATAGGKRFQLGRRLEGGRYGLQFFVADGKPVAGMGESQGGSGIAAVFDAAGKIRASVYVVDKSGSGIVSLGNASEQAVATLSGTGEDDSGLLLLKDSSGAVDMVQAGMYKGHGVVRAGPGAFQQGFGPALGLPASYIEGVKQ